MATKKELLELAEVIRTQTEENANTANLVGSLLKLIINYAADTANAVNQTVTEILADALSQLTPGEGGEYILDGVTSGTFNEENNTIELKNAAGEVISTIDLSSLVRADESGTAGGDGEDYSNRLLTSHGSRTYINPSIKNVLKTESGVPYVEVGTRNANKNCVTVPIPVSPGDTIHYTGRVVEGFPAVLGFTDIVYQNSGSPYARLLNPKIYLGDWEGGSWEKTVKGSRFWDARIEIGESDNVNYVMCSGWTDNVAGAPTMVVTKNGEDMYYKSPVPMNYPTKTFIAGGKKILVSGASFSEDYEWIKILQAETGIAVVDDARGGSHIQGNLAARLMYRQIQGSGITATALPHGIVFSDITVGNGEISVRDTFTDYGVIIINHVYNDDIFKIRKRGTVDPTLFTAEDYETYFKVVDENGNDITLSSIGEVTSIIKDKTKTSLWKVIPRNSSDKVEMTFAEAFDYCIKRIKSWNNTIRTFDSGDTKYPINDLQIIITSHWNPGRSVYNKTSRLLADKHNLCYCELDNALGFTQGDDVTFNSDFKLKSGGSTIAAGTYNKSVLYSMDIDDSGEEVNGKNYWGRHLKKGQDNTNGNNYNAGYYIDNNGNRRNTTWPQQAWAHAIMSCLGMDAKVSTGTEGEDGGGSDGNDTSFETTKNYSDSRLTDGSIEFQSPVIMKTVYTSQSGSQSGRTFVAVAKTTGSDSYPYPLSITTAPIRVAAGDKLRYSGWTTKDFPAVIFFKVDSDIIYPQNNNYAIVYGPTLLLGKLGDSEATGIGGTVDKSNDNVDKYENVEIEIAEDGYVLCCAWGANRLTGEGQRAPGIDVRLRTSSKSDAVERGALTVRREGGSENFRVSPDGTLSVWYKGEYINLQYFLARIEDSINASGNKSYEPVGTFGESGNDTSDTDNEYEPVGTFSTEGTADGITN